MQNGADVPQKSNFRAFGYALLLHLGVITLMLVNFESRPPPRHAAATAEPLKASVVDQDPLRLMREADEARTRRAAAEQREAARKEQESRAQALRAEKKRVETAKAVRARAQARTEQAQRALKQAKAGEAARRKTETDRKRLVAEQARQQARQAKAQAQQEQADRTHEAEAQMRRALAEEDKARRAVQVAEQSRRARAEVARYIDLIRQKVERHWNRPPDTESRFECVLRIRLTAGGEVVQVEVMRPSGNSPFDRSVENAVRKASPLPVPNESAVFESHFREFEFRFRPGVA